MSANTATISSGSASVTATANGTAGSYNVTAGTAGASNVNFSLTNTSSGGGGSTPVNGVCGSANGQTFTSAPTSNLCSVGSASAVSGAGPWTWSCAGSNSGNAADCSASIQSYTVTTTDGTGGAISPVNPAVNHGATVAFTVTANTGYAIDTVTGCGGALSGTTYTTGAITSDCTVTASFRAQQLTLTVTYNGNGSTGGTAPVDLSSPYAQNATVTVLGVGNLVKTGSTFARWNTAANGSCTGYAAGATFAMGTSNVTLYAQWTTGPTLTPSQQTVSGQVGTAITATTAYTATGFSGTVSYTISPALPVRLRFNTITGVISGTPNVRGAYSHTGTGTGTGTRATGKATANVILDIKQPSGITLTSKPNPSKLGEQVTLTATVSDASETPSGITPSGTVTFDGMFNDGSPLNGFNCEPVTLRGGTATCTTTLLTVGEHQLTTRYLGNSTFAGSTSGNVLHTVAGPPTINNTASCQYSLRGDAAGDRRCTALRNYNVRFARLAERVYGRQSRDRAVGNAETRGKHIV